MSTVPNLPAASAVASTDHLWLTQGTGEDRDTKVTVAQIGDTGHKSLAFGDASAVAATDKLFLVQGTGASKDKMGTVGAVVQAAIVALPSEAMSDTAEVVLKDGVSTNTVPLNAFVPEVVDLAKLTSNVPYWYRINSGSNMDWGDAVGYGHLTVRSSRVGIQDTQRQLEISLFANFAGIASSSTNTNSAEVWIPEAAFPTGWMDDIAAVLAADPPQHMFQTTYVMTPNNVVPSTGAHGSAGVLRVAISGASPSRTLLIIFAKQWKDIQPVGGTANGTLQAHIVFAPSTTIPATL